MKRAIISFLCIASLVFIGCGEDNRKADEDSQQEKVEGKYMADVETKLADLSKINPDTYAWLEIAGTDISFPILQSPEDEYYYLTHNSEREEDNNGSIYTEYYNNKDFCDPNTVIYGRNTKDMFGKLHQYQDRDFFDDHREIKIHLADEELVYQIFAAYPYDDRHLIATYDFWEETVFSSYLGDVFSIRTMDAFIDDTEEVTAVDRIITLSTGVTGQEDKRYLIQAVLRSQT